MTTAQQMYHINLDQIASLIKATGHKRTTLVQGHMGTGKSSLLNALWQASCPQHTDVLLRRHHQGLG
jgi:predicted GTPase